MGATPIAMPPLTTWSGAPVTLEQLQQVQLGSTGNVCLTSHLGAVPLSTCMPPHAQLQLPAYVNAMHSNGGILSAYSVPGHAHAHLSEQQLLQGQLVVASEEQLEQLLLVRPVHSLLWPWACTMYRCVLLACPAALFAQVLSTTLNC